MADIKDFKAPRAFNMPRDGKRSPMATGCAAVIVAWLALMAVLLLVAVTWVLARLAWWAVGA